MLSDTISDKAINAFTKAAHWNLDNESDNLYNLNTRNLIVDNYIGREYSRRERIRIINTLSKNFAFQLYTNENTSNLPHVKNKGVVEPMNEVFKIFKSSKINLNIASKTIKSGLPLRIFDIMGAGGFLITNYQSELPEYFEINKDLVVYESIDDLIHKTSYYLTYEQERLEIAKMDMKRLRIIINIIF